MHPVSDQNEIRAMFIRVRRDCPTMDGVDAAIFAAKVLGIQPLEIWLAVDAQYLFANPPMPMRITHNGVPVSCP